MFKLYIHIISCLLFSSVCYAAAPVAEELASLLEPIISLQANFEQDTPRQKGKFLLTKPNLFRWESQTDNSLVIADGQHIWHYEPDLEQVIVQPITVEMKNNPAFLLAGDTRNLINNYVINYCNNKTKCFKLTPKLDTMGIQWMQISFDAEGELAALQLLDQLGHTTQFIFSRVLVNKPISELEFKFKVPAGVDVIKNY